MSAVEKKVVVVTGGATGIGLACVRRFARDGYRVVLLDIDETAAVASAASLRQQGQDILAVTCDVSRRAQLAAALDDVLARDGRLDVMVNNAAVLGTRPALEVDDETFDRVLGVNLKGTFYGTQEAARRMVGRGGAIVNMSSLQARLAIAGRLPYAVSKAGINQLTAQFAIELAPHNIRVNAVAPGTIMTESLAASDFLADAEKLDGVMARTPLGRIGTSEEVADVVMFLASDASSYITGQTIYVDGGRSPLNMTMPSRSPQD